MEFPGYLDWDVFVKDQNLKDFDENDFEMDRDEYFENIVSEE